MSILDARISAFITNFGIFVVVVFSPFLIPLARFPCWACTLHQILPCYHMSNLIRSGLTDGLAVDVGRSLAILLVWTAVSWVVVARVVAKRG